MQVQLAVLSKADNELTKALFPVKDKVSVGRHLSSPVLLQGETLSRSHFVLLQKESGLELEDVSSNGTWLNGKQLTKNVSAPVESGDVIDISGYRMEVLLAVPANFNGIRLEGELPDVLTDPKSSTTRLLLTALHFFNPLEIVLILLSILTLALIAYNLTH